MENRPYLFSVIMAVYNVESYLEEALASLESQSIGFGKIQVILVDDGSRDQSGAICDRWAARHPDQITVIHRENGGVSAARNAGLRLARGKYLNFMDSDDRMAPKTFERVFSFFEQHEHETDVVSIPVVFFDAQEGNHWQNRKFDRGSRVVNLAEEYRIQQTFTNSAFFVRKRVEGLRFDERLAVSEDFKYVLQALMARQTLGLMAEGTYYYRRRQQGGSAINGSTRNKNWYTSWFDCFFDGITASCKERFGRIPGWVQYMLLCDLKWRIASDYQFQMSLTLDSGEQAAYLERLRAAAWQIDPEVILDAPEDVLEAKYKYWMLRQREGEKAEILPGEEMRLGWQGRELFPCCRFRTEICWIRETRDGAEVEGLIWLLPDTRSLLGELQLISGEERQTCETELCPARSEIRFDKPVEEAWAFRGRLPLSAAGFQDVWLCLCGPQGQRAELCALAGGKFLPVSAHSGDMGITGGLRYIVTPSFIRFIPCRTRLRRLRRELRINAAQLRHGALGMILYRWGARLLRHLKRKPVWLIADRMARADDNGETFFRYMSQRREVKSHFVISRESPAFRTLGRFGSVLDPRSIRYKLTLLTCDAFISSDARNAMTEPFGERTEWVRDLLTEMPYVFLQHGVIINDLSAWANRWNEDFAGFITSAEREKNSIATERYGYSEKKVWLTGLARYDRLEEGEGRAITMMPTWRNYLQEGINPATGERTLSEGFENSAYYRFFHGLLNDEELIGAAEKYGYRLQFFPHPLMQPYMDRFRPDQRIHLLLPETSFREVFAQSSLMVTDYSSAVFDFSYLRKPVIYAQFDRDSFYRGAQVYRKGYFDYEKDGMGPVTVTEKETVRAILDQMSRGCVMEKKYRDRADRFYAFSDRNSCERIRQQIERMLAERKGKGTRA